MFSSLFKSYTSDDLSMTLCNNTFYKNKAEKIFQEVSFKEKELGSFLHLCVEKNFIESVKWLIIKKVDINFCNDEGDSAIILASRLGHFELVKFLLHNTCDLEVRNKNGRIAIQEAVKNAKNNVYHLLKSKCLNINHSDLKNHCLVFDAVDSNSLELTNTIVNNVNIKIPKEIISYANLYQNFEIFKLIFSKLDSKTMHYDKIKKHLFSTFLIKVYLQRGILIILYL